MTKSPFAITAACAALWFGQALADCGKGSKTIFSYVTTAGKRVEVCDSQTTIDYSFGRPSAAPEIVVKAIRKDASTYQWNGFGRSRTYSVSVPNGDTLYTAFFSWDSLAPNSAPEAGVEVQVGEKIVAKVRCSKSSKVRQELEGIDLKPTKR